MLPVTMCSLAGVSIHGAQWKITLGGQRVSQGRSVVRGPVHAIPRAGARVCLTEGS